MTIIAKANPRDKRIKTLTSGEWYEVTHMLKWESRTYLENRFQGWYPSNRIEDAQIISVINNKGIERRYSKRHFSEFGIGDLFVPNRHKVETVRKNIADEIARIAFEFGADVTLDIRNIQIAFPKK